MTMSLSTQNKQAVICGICGGIGSGKSFIADRFRALGAAVFDADLVGHQVLMRSDVKEELVARWGSQILNADSEIDRSKVAELVFAETQQGRLDREFLQSLSHPLIQQELARFIAQTEAEVVILDVALLFETGWHTICDQVVFVEATEAVRLRRCQERGWDAEQFRLREASQWSLEAKRDQSDFVIENNGDSQRTNSQLEAVWQHLSSLV